MKKSWALRRTLFDSLSFSFLMTVVLLLIWSPTEEELLNISKIFGIYMVFFFVGSALSALLSEKQIQTWGEKIFQLPQSNLSVFKWDSFWKWQATITLLTAFAVSVFLTELSLFKILDRDGFSGAMRLFEELFQPNFAILPRAILLMIETIFMAFLATSLAIPLAFILSFLAAKNIMKSPFAQIVYHSLRIFLNLMRSVEVVMWAIIFSVWVGIGPAAGLLALMIHSIASLAKQGSEIVEGVSEGPIEGVQSCGANQFQTIIYAIVPQIILPYISFAIYRWDINVRMATIVGFVGGGGIGQLLFAYQGQAQWKEVGCIFFVIAVVVWLLDQSSAYLREALK